MQLRPNEAQNLLSPSTNHWRRSNSFCLLDTHARTLFMYADALSTLGDQASAKLAHQNRSLVGHLIRSMLAGMYVGAAIVLIFTIGGLLSQGSPGAVRLLMGVCFGGALTIVVFAGSELFTGSNLVLTVGVLARKATWGDLAANWIWTWIGNL